MRARLLLAGAVGTVAVIGGLLPASAAATGTSAAQQVPFARFAQATITPGVQTVTAPGTDAAGQCTANFVFVQPRKGAPTRVFVGQSAHCASAADGAASSTETDGCTTRSLPLGTRVQVEGARQPGRLAYSSWVAMQRAGERSAAACAHNDFALVELHPSDVRRTNPSVPVFGGPTRLTTSVPPYTRVMSVGDSGLRLGVRALGPKDGWSLGTRAAGWSTDVVTVSPGVPGDSGSGFLASNGEALGTLSTLELAPLAGSNGVSGLAKQLAYAQRSLPGLRLVPGTEPFRRRF